PQTAREAPQAQAPLAPSRRRGLGWNIPLIRLILIALAALCALAAGPAIAAPGDLDPSFGGTGLVAQQLGDNTGDGDFAFGVAAQPDGKTVAAGRTNDGAGIVRLNSDGTPDATFDGDGSLDFPIATTGAGATDVALQSDGAVVAAVPTGSGLGDGFTLIRVDSHGA